MGGTDESIGALIVLPSRSGRQVDDDTVITAENLSDYEYEPENAAVVADALTRAGFQVGQPAGISLPIMGPPSLYEEYFGTTLARGEGGAWTVRTDQGEVTAELPIGDLPPTVAGRIVAATFEPPVELHLDSP